MSKRGNYQPGPATGARIDKHDDVWTLVLVRDLKHPPELVWEALTDPAQLKEWAPFDADRNLGSPGPAKLTTVGTPMVNDTVVSRAEKPKALELSWGGGVLRWELEPQAPGTRLTLWHNINKGFISMGAAGWHVSLDVLDRLLAREPIGRIVGPEAMQFDGWQRLNREYAAQFGVQAPAQGKERGP